MRTKPFSWELEIQRASVLTLPSVLIKVVQPCDGAMQWSEARDDFLGFVALFCSGRLCSWDVRSLEKNGSVIVSLEFWSSEFSGSRGA